MLIIIIPTCFFKNQYCFKKLKSQSHFYRGPLVVRELSCICSCTSTWSEGPAGTNQAGEKALCLMHKLISLELVTVLFCFLKNDTEGGRVEEGCWWLCVCLNVLRNYRKASYGLKVPVRLTGRQSQVRCPVHTTEPEGQCLGSIVKIKFFIMRFPHFSNFPLRMCHSHCRSFLPWCPVKLFYLFMWA